MEINVTINPEELQNVHSDMVEFFVLHKLKDAGVPVEGNFVPKLQNDKGTLESYYNAITDKYHFKWTPNEKN